jgi:hypothetical protein
MRAGTAFGRVVKVFWLCVFAACASEDGAPEAAAASHTGCTLEQCACVSQGSSVCCAHAGARVGADAGCVDQGRVHFCTEAEAGGSCGVNTALSCYRQPNGDVFLTGNSWPSAELGLAQCEGSEAASARALPACP